MGELLVVLLLIPPRGAEKLTQLSMSKPNANVGLWQLVGWAATVLGSWNHLNQAPGGFPLNLTTPFFSSQSAERKMVKCENHLGV